MGGDREEAEEVMSGMRLDECRICLEPKREHHDFEPYPVPKCCVCDPREWGNPSSIPPVCKEYEADLGDEQALCGHCEHLPNCHGGIR